MIVYRVGNYGRACHPDLNAVDEVRAAALRLDGIKPGWATSIDPLELNLESARWCVCGQNGLDYDAVFVDRPGMDVTLWRVFEPLWLEEIAERIVPVREPAYAGGP